MVGGGGGAWGHCADFKLSNENDLTLHGYANEIS